MRAVVASNPLRPPQVMSNRHVPPAIREIHIQTVRTDPTKLVSLELQLLLNTALPEPVIAEDDDVGIELAFEEIGKRPDRSAERRLT